MKVLITGRAASGKSAVTSELVKRGYQAFDTDEIEGLSSWQDISTGNLISIENNTFVDLQRYRWIWDETKLSNLLSQYNDVFICGGADNDISLSTYFDKHYVLDITPETQIERLKNRVTNDYGKDPRMFSVITASQADHVAKANARGAFIINANQPIELVVNAVLDQL